MFIKNNRFNVSIITSLVLIISLILSYGKVFAYTQNDFSCAVQGGISGTCFYNPNDCSSSTTSNISLIGNDNEQKIYNYFISKGLSPVQAAGIDGNFGQESHWNPYDSGGYLAQWSTSRQAGLAQLASQENLPITNLGVQLDFVWQELNSDYKSVLTNLEATANIGSAVNVFMGPDNLNGLPVPVTDPSQRSGGYEDPGIPEGQNRLSYAESALALYGNGASPGSSPITTGSACGTTASTASVGNCSSITGDPKILCEAEQYNGIYYEYGGGHSGYSSFIANCPDPSNPPNNQPNGGPVNGDPSGLSGNLSPCGLDCSGLVSIAVDEAFNQTYMWTVDHYAMQGSGSQYWKQIPVYQATTGDIVTLDEHVEIVDHISGSSIYTFGAHYTGTKIGEVSSPVTSWGDAYKWIGPGSS
jgi:hypothetical protein